MTDDSIDTKLLTGLANVLVAGKLSYSVVKPVLDQVAIGTPVVGISRMAAQLDAAGFRSVATTLRERRIQDADEYFKARAISGRTGDTQRFQLMLGDLPMQCQLGWRDEYCSPDQFSKLMKVTRDRRYARSKRVVAPISAERIESVYKSEGQRLLGEFVDHDPQFLLTLLADVRCELTEDDAAFSDALQLVEQKARLYAASVDRRPDESRVDAYQPLQARDEERLTVLDRLCADAELNECEALTHMIVNPIDQSRAAAIFTMRFGSPNGLGFVGWGNWFRRQQKSRDQSVDRIQRLADDSAAEVLLMWYVQQPDQDAAAVTSMEEWCEAKALPVNTEQLVEVWGNRIPSEERASLLGDEYRKRHRRKRHRPAGVSTVRNVVEKVESKPVQSELAAELAAVKAKAASEFVAAEPPVPAGPSLWNDHLRPFFAEHWYIVAGVLMVIAGSSLLAYYTWDKHWLVRYSIMPLLLAGFTWTLGWLGEWTEKRDPQLSATAAILRGAAIGLLPVNFMAVALLSKDQSVPHQSLAVIVMSGLYLVVFGRGLKRWCSGVHGPLGWLLGGTLLMLNALVMVGPIATRVGGMDSIALRVAVGVGFYIGFMVMAFAVVRFTRHVLTREIVENERIAWFFGATLAMTFVQVFIWVHSYLRHVPQVSTYALMVVMGGGLILLVERRALELLDRTEKHRGESFMGFALLLLGVLMGFTQPHIRIASFVLAGLIWLYQAANRPQQLHHWIGLTLVALGGASIGLSPEFPKQWLPVLGLAVAGAMSLFVLYAGRRERIPLRQAAIGMQASALFVTAIVAVLAQWHFRSPGLWTCACLVAVAAGFGFRAWRDQKLRYTHTGMTLLAVALPYAGCVDVMGRSLHGNTLPFGLAILSLGWLGLNAVTSAKMVRDARSTVLWIFGSLGVAAMLLRVAFELGNPGDALWYRAAMDYSGPLLLAVALVFTTWYSRSLVPAAMAAIVLVILFPELKAQFRETFETLQWGSGLGSASSAIGLMLVCFALRPAKFLKDLGPGDQFMGTTPFPIRRFDHTLFTWPIVASIIFLIVKTDTVTLLRNLNGGVVAFKTALALGVTAVVWKLLAAYHHADPKARVATYIGCALVFAGWWFGLPHALVASHWSDRILAGGLTLQGLFLLYQFVVKPKWEWAENSLARPTSDVLDLCAIVFPLLAMAAMWFGSDGQRFLPFVGFTVAQLAWHGIARQRKYNGYVLFSLVAVVLLALTAPGSGYLGTRIAVGQSLTPLLYLLLAVFAVHVLLEFRSQWQAVVAPLSEPALVLSTALLLGLIAISFFAPVKNVGLENNHFALLIVGGLLMARTHRSLGIALLTCAVAYLHVHLHYAQDVLLPVDLRLATLIDSPWRIGSFGMTLVVLYAVGRRVHRRSPRVVAGQFSFEPLVSTNAYWFLGPALALTVYATGVHTAVRRFRDVPMQLTAPFMAAATWGLVGWLLKKRRYWLGGILLLVAGNIHVVRIVAGDWLQTQGISEIQIACLGIALTLLLLTAVRFVLRRDVISVFVNHISLGLAGCVLALLSANYFVHPNLAEIPWQRFVASGVMAYLAGLYFRRAARNPAAGEAAHVDLCEGFYHFGVTLASWCALLLIPQLRHPAVALCALALPVAYFYLRAELGTRAGLDFARRYRNTASVLGLAVLTGYAFRAMLQMVLFPDEPQIQTDYYHYNAPVILILSAVLLRLKGLGGTWWLGVYGGLATLVSTYFCATAIPGQSPFDFPIAGAWWAVCLSHFFTVASQHRSPLRTGVQRLAAIDTEEWLDLRKIWGICLLVATQAAVAWGILHWQGDTKAVAPLLAAAASILIHHGILRRSALYFGIAGLQLFAALHMDFVIPSYVPREWIVWVVAGVWAMLLVLHAFTVRKTSIGKCGTVATALAALLLAHVVYHHPESTTGLWGMGIGMLCAALTPRYSRAARTGEERVMSGLLLVGPVWLAWFSQSHLRQNGLAAATELWPTLVAISVVVAIGFLARGFQTRWRTAYDKLDRTYPRLFDHTCALMNANGHQIHLITSVVAFAVTVCSQVMHYGRPFESRELVLMLVLYASMAVGWFVEAKSRRSMLPYIVLQLCVLGFFAVGRRQLMLTTDLWTAEYDIWASLVVSFGLTGAKQFFDLQPREARIPLLGTLFTLPIVGMLWVLYNQLGTDTALMVIGLHSLMFAFMGRESKESPFNVVAIGGFAAFVSLAFWSRLQIRVVHAYTIPVGLAILILLQLFRERIAHETRNRIRLVTLLTMVGSVAWYALADNRYPVAFNMTLIGVCIAAMLFGSFFRIRLYVLIGFAGLVVDVISLVYKTMVTLERSSRMTAIGGLVLLIGVTLVFGAIYYKTNRDRMNEQLDRWRKKFGAWE
ncbi:hypothetical protein OAH18_00265 [bacterium]|nr:hypothetical protein [bacterium]